MTFPETNATLRTNDSFREHKDGYHKDLSPLEEIADFDMVNQMPFDYVHTVLLGVMKKMIGMWISGDTTSKLPSILVKQISGKLEIISTAQPSELQRKIRPLADSGHFKGTEFRTFLLYSGPVALRHVLPLEKYKNFLLLHTSISILCDPETCSTHSELVLW